MIRAIIGVLIIAVGGGAGYYFYKKKTAGSGPVSMEIEYPEGLSNKEGMLAILKIKEEEFADPQNFYANSTKFENLLNQEAPAKAEDRVKWRTKLGIEAMNSGKTPKAIEVLEAARKDVEEAKIEGPVAMKMYEQLGMAYLRKAELDNCLENHNSESCIIPFTENAEHRNREGSTKAQEVYERILEINPEHNQAMYMLNLCHITLGTYPEGVPEKWRVKEDMFTASDNLPRFENVAELTGLNAFSTSGSANIDDFNGDGYLDLFTSGFGLNEQAQLFFADGKGGYDEVTVEAGLEGLPGGLNTTHCDYNNDGYRDIFILRGGWWNRWGHVPNSLLRNNGDGTFTDVTKESGIISFYPTQAAVWADFNNDGWVDVFIGNESSRRTRNNPCELFRNNGDGTFTNVAQEAGLVGKGYIKGVNAGDYDNDGLSDIYINVFNGSNYLYHNLSDENGIKFEDVTEAQGVTEPQDGFPTWFFDYNNDGWLDLVALTFDTRLDDAITNEFLGRPVDHEAPKFYRNNQGKFEDATDEIGMNTMLMSMGSNYGDMNNDGWLDLYVGTGKPDLRALYPNRMFMNESGSNFTDITAAGGFGHLQKGHAIVFADMDNDGDQDIYAQMGGAVETDFFQNALFENPGFGNGYINLRLRGYESNRDGIGARIEVIVEENGTARSLHRVIGTGGSFGGGSTQEEIGLGTADSILAIKVYWPVTGETTEYSNVPLNATVQLHEEGARVEVLNLPAFRFGGEAEEGEEDHEAEHSEHDHSAHAGS
jgi:tetratricopeptide (TPR) repeat protein